MKKFIDYKFTLYAYKTYIHYNLALVIENSQLIEFIKSIDIKAFYKNKNKNILKKKYQEQFENIVKNINKDLKNRVKDEIKNINVHMQFEIANMAIKINNYYLIAYITAEIDIASIITDKVCIACIHREDDTEKERIYWLSDYIKKSKEKYEKLEEMQENYKQYLEIREKLPYELLN